MEEEPTDWPPDWPTDWTGCPIAVGVQGSYVEIARENPLTGKPTVFRGVAAELGKDGHGTYLMVRNTAGKTRIARLMDVEVLRKSKELRERQKEEVDRAKRVEARQSHKTTQRRKVRRQTTGRKKRL
jgi:hypothetical protein